MPVYRLIDELVFPPPHHAEPDGLLAVGGDLSSERLLLAYRMGIFPWYGEGQPILWWSPDPRLVLDLQNFHISRRLHQMLRKRVFQVTFDRVFAKVIQACATTPRKGQQGTWIIPEMRTAYIRLHELGYCHSVESWRDGELVGGIYGVSLGRAFFGESMFFRISDASKVALAALVERLKAWDFHMIDAQVTTRHLISLGAQEMSRKLFLRKLEKALRFSTIRGKWDINPSR
ncbi:MAG: leucyl/phenylalanyl-tRNA--protein transferase [Deltaproteobacteria bacterium]|nr:leucyl/phenylalanyl-tRNA--protein transferase [Deltaproteobacteria bacterium]